MAATDAQVRKLMEELSKHGKVGLAAARAGMDPKTAAKHRAIVEAALQRLLEEDALTSAEQVKALVLPAKPEVPELAAPSVDLRSYDVLVETREEVAS